MDWEKGEISPKKYGKGKTRALVTRRSEKLVGLRDQIKGGEGACSQTKYSW